MTPQSHGWGYIPNNPKQEFMLTLDQGPLGSSIHNRQRAASLLNHQPSLPPSESRSLGPTGGVLGRLLCMWLGWDT